jgi:transposase
VCGKDLVKIGEDITEQLDVEPAKLFVSTATSVRNMLAVTVKPSPPRRFLPPSSTLAWPPWAC